MSNTWKHPYTPARKYSKRVAYLSMEFGIDQALKIYSGGLGYLAGSHMRAAYQLKQNLIGIGMLWRYGYYDQDRDSHGLMVAKYREKFYSYLEDTRINFHLNIHDNDIVVKVFYLDPKIFGTVPMYFLSTDIPENDYLARSIMDRLYNSNEAARVAQNIVLGVGGVKLCDILGGTDIVHLNEAHALPAAFYLLGKYGNLDEVKKRVVFTTHTPEKAGNSVRSMDLLTRMGFFNGSTDEEVRRISHTPGDYFEYTPAALRMAKIANGVSQLHGIVANEMWKDYENICEIIGITNSQDEVYWMDSSLKLALEQDNDEAFLSRKHELKKELFKIVADQTGDLFDPDVLTIVWARRFAGYKRADLLLKDMERFIKMVSNEKRPVQFIWAGKPYPEDHSAIQQFNHLVDISKKHKNLAVLTGYELSLSAALKRGSDIWLNTPRRPQEASGTSGMTAAMNGSVNLSINDGWIPEFAKNGVNAFTIPEADVHSSIEDQSIHDHIHLMEVLENTIIPMYYKEPKKWNAIVKNGMRDVTKFFDSKRMADEYYTRMYNI
jgi:starch phosphorylase